MFRLRQKTDLKYYVIEEFVKTGLVDHAFSTRIGGVSPGDFASLNLGFHTEDDKDNVLQNRKKICDALKIDYSQIIAGEQVHSDNIKVVTEKDRGKGALDYENAIAKTDALITNQAKIALTSYYADCVPIIILDPGQEVIALAHAGWKGTVNKIGQKTILRMQKEFDSCLEDILVGIGPSIGPCCYEVDEHVVAPLRESFNYWEDLLRQTGKNRWKLDLWETNCRQLQEVGILKENIIASEICTACNTDQFYSYRAENGSTGRMASIIQLK